VFRCLPEVIVLRQSSQTVDGGKTRAIEHFHEATLAGIESYVGQALVLNGRLVEQEHPRLIFRKAHALEEKTLLRKRTETPNGKEWIFQVVEESHAKD
jgi:hypothetical protein